LPLPAAAALPKAPSEPLALRRRMEKTTAKTPKLRRAKKSETDSKAPDITDYLGEPSFYQLQLFPE
jgi:hypothetical protein